MLEKQHIFFNTNITKSYDFRIKNLLKLKKIIINSEEKITMALKKDLNKSYEEAYITEIVPLINEINFLVKNLKKLMKPKKVKTNLLTFKSKSYLYNEPLGNVLILSPWNYPFLLALNPLVGSIAAGNTTVIKPSEVSENTSLLIEELISNNFDEDYIKVILGDATVANSLTKLPFNKIFFTGSENVAKKVLQNAASNLIPTTLELGGKSPTIIFPDTNLKDAVKKIVFGKLINAGQTCIAPDYVLLHKNNLNDFIYYFKYYTKSFYNEPLENEKYPKIINEYHFNRLIEYLNKEKVLLGGNFLNKKLIIEPTIIKVNDYSTNIMQEEIFGPILPIMTYQNTTDLFNKLDLNKKPLTMYVFTKDKNNKRKMLTNYSSGSIVFNDTISQFVNNNLPFGGIGNSGMGKYHGTSSFHTFSHQKSVLDKSLLLDLKIRYMPYSNNTIKFIKKFVK